MASKVYWGSPHQTRLSAAETLPAKLDLILEKLNIRERVKDELVAIKVHLGGNIGYSMIHPVFMRKVVQAVKEGGGRPFITDHSHAVTSSPMRGYTSETVGCPIIPVGGLNEQYFYPVAHEYRNIKEWRVAGQTADATFLIDFAHVKGHPSCSYGGAVKNLALGCVVQPTRSQMHDTCHFDQYWFPEKCKGKDHRQAIIDSCPFGAIVSDKEDAEGLHLHYDNCNQCMRCQEVSDGAFLILKSNFLAFLEANIISAKLTLDRYEEGKKVFLNLATDITPVCDCFGFTGAFILPNAGIFGSDDIVALENATLDVLAEDEIIEENVPNSMEVVSHDGHPLQWIHGQYKDPYHLVEKGEEYGIGKGDYDLVDVLPVEEIDREPLGYIAAGGE